MTSGRHQAATALADVLPRLLAKRSIEGECWIWTGYVKNGYGAISIGNRDVYVHRLSWELHNGSVPGDLFVLHRCDRRRCFSPSCLFLGTQATNLLDMRAKGRGSPPPIHRGEAHSMAKLTDGQVSELRERFASGETQRSLALRYGVSRSTVWRLGHGVYREAGHAV